MIGGSRHLTRAWPLVLALSACGSGQPFDRAEAPILGGQPAPSDQAVVAVVNFAGGQCSGSLITPELVLTARHCGAATANKDVQVVCGKTTFEPPNSAGAVFVVALPEISNDPKDYLAVAEILMPEGLGDDLCGTDVVLLRLKKPVRDITPLRPRLDTPPLAQEPYSALGFGLDESLADRPSGVRKRLDGLSVICAGSGCGERAVLDNEWIGSGGPCSGDSGGPALSADGSIIGVVSRGTTGCKGPVFSDVASRRDWLEAQAVSAANAAQDTPPDWAPCDALRSCADATPPPAPDSQPAATCSIWRPSPRGNPAWAGVLYAAGALLRRRHARKNRDPRRSERL